MREQEKPKWIDCSNSTTIHKNHPQTAKAKGELYEQPD
jgi:hypothetical protein